MSEFEILRQGLTGWRRPAPEPAEDLYFYHRRNGYPAILGAILMAVVVETVAVHFLLSLWLEPVAWVFTTLSVYSMIWLLGDYQIARQNPIRLDDQVLHLQTGARWKADVPRDSVTSMATPNAGLGDVEKLALTLFGDPDFWLLLDEPVEIRGPFGIRKSAAAVGIGVEEPKRLKATLGLD
jgi:hypothetical protein